MYNVCMAPWLIYSRRNWPLLSAKFLGGKSVNKQEHASFVIFLIFTKSPKSTSGTKLLGTVNRVLPSQYLESVLFLPLDHDQKLNP